MDSIEHMPTVSIIINTDGRVESLKETLRCLRHLRYAHFEVVVVAGPTRDGTHELLEEWGSEIKVGYCPLRNLSLSRNISLRIAAGEIIAFLDDDSLPEPEWLEKVLPPFRDPKVAVSGGFLLDHTGKQYQWRFGALDRFGVADESWNRATPEFNFPNSFNFPHVMANSAFRRHAVVEAGGFDEEYDYYLDESDLICRLNDAGCGIIQLDGAHIHHKYMPSVIRNKNRVPTSWYTVIKNKIYFCFINGGKHSSVVKILDRVQDFINEQRKNVHYAISEGLLDPDSARRFEDECDRGWREGLAAAFRKQRRLIAAAEFESPTPFLPFKPYMPGSQQRCFVFLSANFPPEPVGGIGRYVDQLSRAIAAMGHQVHVLTKGEGHDRVDFVDGVWVHRIVVRHYLQQNYDHNAGFVPQHLWNYSSTMLSEAKEIATRRPIDCVHAPLWDIEGIAFLRDGSFTLITSLHTPTYHYIESHKELEDDRNYMEGFAKPVMRAEAELLLGSDGILANSFAIIGAIEGAYHLKIDASKTRVVPRGLQDLLDQPREDLPTISNGVVRILFVGRLEPRKGIDVFFDAIPELLERYPNIFIYIVGNNTIRNENGQIWQDVFDASCDPAVRSQVAFHGEVSELALRGFYHGADIIVAPSRFESFGLVHLEGMMFGKPVIGSRAGGMVEVVQHETTGLLAEPGDAASLRACIERLIVDPDLRQQLGRAARLAFESLFSVERMVAAEVAFMDDICDAARCRPNPKPRAPMRSMPIQRPQAPKTRRRVTIVNHVIARYDAISADVISTWMYLNEDRNLDVSILTARNDFEEIPARVISDVGELLLTREFREADLLIYHFGIYSPLLDALLVGNGHAKQAVFFHNITPPELVHPNARETVELSYRQLNNLRVADRVWPVSKTNEELLIDYGFNAKKMQVIPFGIESPKISRLCRKPADVVNIVYLGRVVKAKGVIDLLKAIHALSDSGLPLFKLKIVGNAEYSDSKYYDQVKNFASRYLSNVVEFVGTVTSEERDAILLKSHILAIPSYHEGFCKPVIEGLRAGCVPVGYAAHNLRYIAGGLGKMVAVGDIGKLGDALASLITDIAKLEEDPAACLHLDAGVYSEQQFASAVRTYVKQFEPATVSSLINTAVDDLFKETQTEIADLSTEIPA